LSYLRTIILMDDIVHLFLQPLLKEYTMSKEMLTKWYIAGTHAVRSACEQGVEGARHANRIATSQGINDLAAEVAAFTAQNEKNFTKILADLGEQPNDFVDQIMAGISKGSDLMLKASTDKAVTDVALISAGQTALHYFIPAFGTHAAVAKAMGLNDHAEMLAAMADECKVADARYTALAEQAINPLAAA
jgi:ferritin-like metal-binding protein YciE